MVANRLNHITKMKGFENPCIARKYFILSFVVFFSKCNIVSDCIIHYPCLKIEKQKYV